MSLLLDLLYAGTLLPHYLYHRLVTGKYGPETYEKRGRIGRIEPDGRPVLWLHAVSVGEALAARPLVAAFRARFPQWRVLVSTTTATGRAVAQTHFGAENVFYYPLDLSSVIRRVLDRIAPRLIVLMELELWPSLLAEAERRGIPVAVANLRMTERSAARYRCFGPLTRPMIRRVALWLAQDEVYARRVVELGVPPHRVPVVGSLKYDGLDFSDHPEEASRLRAELGGGRLLVAGSTHPGEEEMVLEAFARLRERYGSGLRLVLVPRHPERCDAVARLVPARLRLHRRSAGPAPAESDIVLVDTMGELARLYRAAEIVFVAGSLTPAVGGHNMLEPAAFAKPVVYGPHLHNFEEPARRLEEAAGAVRLSAASAVALADALARLLDAPGEALALGRRAREAARALQGATAKSMERIAALLEARDAQG